MSNKRLFSDMVTVKLMLVAFLVVLAFQSFGESLKTSEDIIVEIGANKVTINGHLFTRDSPLSEYQAKLGKANRVSKLANTIHTYDYLGILLYQSPSGGDIGEIDLIFANPRHDFSPKHPFKGLLRVNGKIIGKSFSQKELYATDFLKIDPAAKGIAFAVSPATFGNMRLGFHHWNSRETLDQVSIAWK